MKRWGWLAGLIPCLVLMLPGTSSAAGLEVVRVGTYNNYPPYTIQDPDGTLRGFEIDMIADLCRRMAVRCTVKAVDWEKVFDDLDAGAYDIYIGGMAGTAVRARRAALSDSYAGSSSGFMTTAGHPLTEILALNRIDLDKTDAVTRKAFEDFVSGFRGRRLGVHVETIHETLVSKDFGSGIDVRRYDSEQALYEDLLTRRLDAVFGETTTLNAFIVAHLGDKPPPVRFGPMLVGGALGQGTVAALRRGDQARLTALNAAIAAAKADSTLSRLSMKWFGYNIGEE